MKILRVELMVHRGLKSGQVLWQQIKANVKLLKNSSYLTMFCMTSSLRHIPLMPVISEMK